MSQSTIITASYNEVINVDFTSDAWFNATSAAKQFNKRPNDWLNLDMTKEYIKLLHGTLFPDLPLPAKMVTAENQLVRTEKGGSVSDSIGGGGTWLHPELAVEFARWLSVGFSIWCNTTIRKILRGEEIGTFKPANPINTDTSTTLISDLQQQHLAEGVGAKARRLDKNTQWMWCAFKKHVSIDSYKSLTLAKYPSACAYLEIAALTHEQLQARQPKPTALIPVGYELIQTSHKVALEHATKLNVTKMRQSVLAICNALDIVDSALDDLATEL
jgi:hypothetical protein